MKLIYHRRVQEDVSAILGYYDEVGGPGLGDTVRILVVRHHHRESGHGIKRS